MASAGAARVLRHHAYFYSANRKLLLSARSWRPMESREGAAVVLSHHIGDHSGRLNRLGGTLASNGIALYAFVACFRKNHGIDTIGANYAVRSDKQVVADYDKFVTKVMQFYTVKGADPAFDLSRVIGEKRKPWDPEAPIAPT
eukprot:gene34211-19219_t